MVTGSGLGDTNLLKKLDCLCLRDHLVHLDDELRRLILQIVNDLDNVEVSVELGILFDIRFVMLAKIFNDLADIQFTDTFIIVLAAVDPSFYYGDWVVRINFTNGQYTFYSCGGYGETFDAEGNCISSTYFSCDDEELKTLVGKYYETE